MRSIRTIALVSVVFYASFIFAVPEMPQAERMEQFRQWHHEIKALAQSVKNKDRSDAYANMRVELSARYMDWLEDDVKQNRTEMVALEMWGMERLLPLTRGYLRGLDDGSIHPVATPRLLPDDQPRINGRQLVQTVKWSDGRIEKDRPVFLFGFGHFGLSRQDVGWLGNLGCNYAQWEMGPSQVWSGPNKWDDNAVAQFHQFFKNAQNAGVLVDLLLSPHYMPEWQFEKHPHWRAHLGGFVRFPINDPEVNAFLRGTNNKLLDSFSDLKQPWSICVANEPVAFKWSLDLGTTKRLWQQYLIERFGSVQAMNKRWKTTYKNFAEAPVYAEPPSEPFPQEPALYDWMRFNDQRHSSWVNSLAVNVGRRPENKPTHAKMISRSFQQYDLLQGVDIHQFANIGTLAGMDHSIGAHALGPKGSGLAFMPYNDIVEYMLMSSSGRRPIANTENHLIPDRTGDIFPDRHMTAALWLEALYGMSTSAAWAWERTGNTSDAFFGLFANRPNYMEEYVRGGLDIMRLAPEVAAFVNTEPRIAVLYSRTTMLRNTDGPKSLFQASRALIDSGIPFTVITEQTLSDRRFRDLFPNVNLLILPGVTHMSDEAWSGMMSYLKVGFTSNEAAVIAIGDGEPIKDPYDVERVQNLFRDTQIAALKVSSNDKDQTLIEDLRRAIAQFKIEPDVVFVDSTTHQQAQGVIVRYTNTVPRLAFVLNLRTSPLQGSFQTRDHKPLILKDLVTLVPDKGDTLVELKSAELRMGPLSNP